MFKKVSRMAVIMTKVFFFDIKIGKKLGIAKNLIIPKPLTEDQRTRDRSNVELSS